jgi:hypothetical protein
LPNVVTPVEEKAVPVGDSVRAALRRYDLPALSWRPILRASVVRVRVRFRFTL